MIPVGYTTRIATLFVVASLPGLVANLLVFTTLVWRRAKFNNSFYLITANLCLGDIFQLLINYWIIGAPLVYHQRELLGGVLWYWLANMDTVSYNAVVIQLILVALNRLLIILGSVHAKARTWRVYALFTDLKLVCAPLIFSWLWGIACGVGLAFGGHCYKVFFWTRGNMGYNCSDYGPSNLLWTAYLRWHFFFEFLVFGIYLAVFALLTVRRKTAAAKAKENKVKQKKSELVLCKEQRDRERSRTERRMLYQVFLVTVCHLLFNVAFFKFSQLEHWIYPVLISIAGIIMSSMNPLIYFVFNPAMRENTLCVLDKILPCYEGPPETGATTIAPIQKMVSTNPTATAAKSAWK